MKAEDLSVKCPECGCPDKHILKDSGTVGIVGGQPHKSSIGFRSKEGKYNCSCCDYIFGDD